MQAATPGVPRHVVSQCDTCILMGMDSVAEFAERVASFGFVPHSLLEKTTAYAQIRDVTAGTVVPGLTLVTFGAGSVSTGGSDAAIDKARS